MGRLKDVTDQKVNMVFLPSDAFRKEDSGIVFGGQLNFSDHTFKLLMNPYDFQTYYKYKLFLHGSIQYVHGRCRIVTWIRPSALGFVYLVLLTIILPLSVMEFVRVPSSTFSNVQFGILSLAVLVIVWAHISAVFETSDAFRKLVAGKGGMTADS